MSSTRPKILQCVSHLALGGAERVALSIIKALRDEVDFSVFAVRGLGDGEVGEALRQELNALGVPLSMGPRIPMKFGGMMTGAFGLQRAVREFAPDLIHLHTEIPEASYAMMVAFRPALRPLPVIRTIHNAVFWEFWRPLGRWCDRRMPCSFVAGVSQDATDAFTQLRKESGAPPPPEPATVVYNGVAPVDHPKAARRTSSQPIRMIFGGRLESQKGTDLLPQILPLVRLPASTEVHLTLRGSGSHEALLRALAQHPPAGWTIEILPPVSDFQRQLSDFDLAIVPSRYEGLALVAIEAFLAGVPVVATDAPGLRETMPEDYPWRARAADAASFATMLTQALAQRDRWRGVAASGREFALGRFAVAAMTEGYRTLYGLAQSARVTTQVNRRARSKTRGIS
jgi:glycosyltransferase involved in cell wall biosynthesis